MAQPGLQPPPHASRRFPGVRRAAIERVLALARQLVGMLLVSLIFSLIVEYVGIAFFWPEEGALHSKAVMETESRYFSEEFTRSLLLSDQW